ncbi:tetraacyldisaccharide 4'-kinase [Larkinella soli]|uniref:tetraacyldisaccharide 4'-kinase n=1 Tax=Larkinella soli TaxID=1770527 RepID=UPI001E2F43B4|nr:tetraacyldisaccharide 4'-kinase [Larkinella soli]
MSARLSNPLNWLYGGVTDLRNWLYDSRIKETLRPPVYTIGVGNLTVGGTGKTPQVDYLLQLLKSVPGKEEGLIATLSRGYGRRTRGFRIAGASDTADTIGDEPLLLYRKHAPGVTVCVGEKRAEAIPQLLTARPGLQVIVLDDAYQHRPVSPHLNLLLTDYHRLFFNDAPFPGGRLRERRHGAGRADAVLVTKCPEDLSPAEQTEIRETIRRYGKPDVPVFFTGLAYGEPVPYHPPAPSLIRRGSVKAPQPPDGGVESGGAKPPEGEKGATSPPPHQGGGRGVVLVSGIARPEPLERYVAGHFQLAAHLPFPDHHRYSAADLRRIRQAVPAGGAVLTTEKDFVKLEPLVAGSRQDLPDFYYLPIAVKFLNSEEQFKSMITLAGGLETAPAPVKKS